MPKDNDVISGEPIESTWGNQVVRDKLVQRATNAADLASGWPAPQDGETVWQQDTNQLWVFDGTQWVEVAVGADGYVRKVGDTVDAADGSVSAPAYSFADQTDSGMFRLSSVSLGFAVDGVELLSMTPGEFYVSSERLAALDGSATSPTYSFQSQPHGMFRAANGHLAFATTGVERMIITDSNGAVYIRSGLIYLENITESGLTPNVVVASDGRLYKSTAVAALKSRVDDLEARIEALEA